MPGVANPKRCAVVDECENSHDLFLLPFVFFPPMNGISCDRTDMQSGAGNASVGSSLKLCSR